jgi:hypothetical protein
MREFIEHKILEAIKDVEESTDALAALTTVLVITALTSGFDKEGTMEVFGLQWDRIEKTVYPKLLELLKKDTEN